jgi:mono/diheme cytochrome c family protein
MKIKILVPVVLFAAVMVMSSFQQPKPWVVPDKYQKMTNAVKTSPGSVAAGKALWVKHCKSCHGAMGKGDGPKAAQLKTDAGDFTTAAFKKQSDGALFYKALIGRDDMPNYEKKIPDQEDIWHLVNYMRTLK